MDSSVVLNRKERGKGQIYFIMLLTPYMITEFYGPGWIQSILQSGGKNEIKKRLLSLYDIT